MSEQYQLMVSCDCGINYHPDKSASELTELQERMDDLDEQMRRWYVEKCGEQLLVPRCQVHIAMIAALEFALEKETLKGETDGQLDQR